MKKINELKQERAALIQDMEAILNTAVESKRSKTEDETNQWTSKNERVASIDAELKVLERQEELNRSIAGQKVTEEEKVSKRYDLGKAIREARSGKLSGLEAEMHQEAERELSRTSGVVGNLYIPSMLIQRANEGTKTVGASAGHIPTFVGDYGQGVVVPRSLFDELGVTVYENLTSGKLDLPFSKGHTAAKVAETVAAAQSVPTTAKGTLTASRYQGWQTYTQEFLSETSVLPAMLADMVASIDRAVGKDLVTKAAAANVLSGFDSGDTAAAVNYAGVLALMSALDTENFLKEGLVMSKELFYALAGKEKASGTAKFIIDLEGQHKGKFMGVNTFGTSFLPVNNGKYDIVYGDFSKSYVGFWGGVQLLVDPYSASNNGYVKITFSRMGDTAVNPYAFASKRNANLS